MAVTVEDLSASTVSAVTSFTMSLKTGWDEIPPEDGGRPPVAGDLVVLEVRRPLGTVTVPGWVTADGRVFWKVIGPAEPDPVLLSVDGAGEWEVHGYAVATEPIAPLGDEVSAP